MWGANEHRQLLHIGDLSCMESTTLLQIILMACLFKTICCMPEIVIKVVRRLSSFACELLCVQIFASIHSTSHILLEAHRYFIFSFEHLLSLVYSKDVCPTIYAKVYKDKTKSP